MIKQSINTETLYLKGIHGITHSYRVLLIARKLADLEQLTASKKELLEFCAIFHDIGRECDGEDNFHGQESISKLNKNNFFGFKKFNNALTYYIIENHCIIDNKAFDIADKYEIKDLKEAIYLLKLFKDADNLDRFRLNDFDSNYLRTENSFTLIPFAKELNAKLFSEIEIMKEFESFINQINTNTI